MHCGETVSCTSSREQTSPEVRLRPLPDALLRTARSLCERWPKAGEVARFVGDQWFSLALVFVLAAAGYAMDEHKAEVAPFLIDWESQALNVLTWADPRVRRADHVTVVEIDDATYRARKQGDRTDRHLLAALVRDAVTANAAVVALDIDLVRDPEDDTVRARANADLLDAIRTAARREPAIPVILAVALKADDGGGWSEVANIFADSALPVVDAAPDLPARAPVGFVNSPLDQRQLPLVFDAKPLSGGSPQPIWSLGLRTADAYDSALDIAPTASDTAPTRAAIADGEFVYGTFLPQSAFLHVSANDLLNGAPQARAALNHRVVLIGGVRHDAEGRWVDLHDTPLGSMPGVYIHANRIEAILDERIKLPVPWWVPWVVDIALGLAMVIVSARARTPADQLGLVALFAAPFVIAYVAFVNLQCSIDFALPLFVLMLHLVLEKYREFGHRKETVKAADAA